MKRRMTLVLIGLLALSMISCNLVSRFTGKAKETAEAAVTSVVATVASLPTATTQAQEPPSGPPEIESDQESQIMRESDGAVMVLIPEGDFIMGADKAPSLPNERPQRTVTLDLYWIDQMEITNAQYKLCVSAGACDEPLSFSSPDYANGYAGDDHPVVGVTWDMANAYCTWAGVRLPSEAEWEKAARGIDGRSYPWGDARPDGTQANMSGDADPYEYTAPVGSFPAGASPYGIMDMTGNAREWVADWYQKDYYANAPSSNPPGPDSGELDMRVSRGGSFTEAEHHSRSSDRMPQKMDLQPQSSPFTVGFRCAAGAPPAVALPGDSPGDQPAPTATTAAGDALTPTATTAAQSPGEGSSGPVETESLDNLTSYRADWTTTMKMPGQDESMVLKYKLEWVKDPPAQHVWMDMATGSFAEVIWIEDKVWVKAGDQWVLGGAESTEQAFENFHNAFEIDDDMTLVGTETVNGMRAKHYVYDFANATQNITMHREIWVADDSSLPAVPVQAHFRMENKSTQGTLVTEIQAHLYDINTPIEIEAPN